MNDLQRRLEQIAKAGLLTRAGGLRNEIVDELSHPGTGATRKRRGVTHRSSAPSEPPAVDTGRLRQSISIDTSDLSSLRVRVGTNVDYAPRLEYGGRTLAPRPFLRPALERFRRISRTP